MPGCLISWREIDEQYHDIGDFFWRAKPLSPPCSAATSPSMKEGGAILRTSLNSTTPDGEEICIAQAIRPGRVYRTSLDHESHPSRWGPETWIIFRGRPLDNASAKLRRPDTIRGSGEAYDILAARSDVVMEDQAERRDKPGRQILRISPPPR